MLRGNWVEAKDAAAMTPSESDLCGNEP